jgi:hypothetical protein
MAVLPTYEHFTQLLLEQNSDGKPWHDIVNRNYWIPCQGIILCSTKLIRFFF